MGKIELGIDTFEGFLGSTAPVYSIVSCNYLGSYVTVHRVEGRSLTPAPFHQQASEGYSGSDIKVACKEAVMRSLRQALEAAECCDNEADGTDRIIPEPVSTQDILDAIEQTKPTGRLLAAKFETWHQEYGSSLS
ncbi:hypothetical protein HPB48_007632 [Haemaphysalis longicornis]|uniref:AAA ATPase AAA+ lid domain-containing protein n=1 Tax=Haemaphysalis longicornis TaxID=44386 RepID=A0A9J6G4Q2_HAELO|nr:hypothetical protein HPB48_007632 [Haemaphysalis longicornis]